jgi:3-methyladenine DNA glycosylase AlkD
MPLKKTADKAGKTKSTTTVLDVKAAIATLKRLATKATRDGMARYGIPSDKAFGVKVGAMHKLAKQLGRNHELAVALWETGWYEARMLACFVDDPELVTPAQMDRWCSDFDSWAICDTACFHLFDRTPHAWSKVPQWARRNDEFVKRAAFALLASLTVHDKNADDESFAEALELVERAASDERNFVKKGVNWALRCIGKRSRSLHSLAEALARRLAESPHPAARWIGKDALRDLASPATKRRLAAKSGTQSSVTSRKDTAR